MLVRKMLSPLIRRFWVLFLSMIAVSCLGIALMTGLRGAYDSFLDGYARYVQEYGYPDAVITTAVTMENREPELRVIDGVSEVNSRMYADLALRHGERTLTLRTFTFAENDFSQFYVREEADGADDPEIYLEYRFCENNSIHAGETVQLNTAEGYQTFFVSKIVSSPECIHMEQNAYSWGDNADFGYGFVPCTEAETVYGHEAYRNQYLLRLQTDSGRNAGVILAECEEALADLEVSDSFLYEDSPVRQKIDLDTQPLKALSVLLPALFFALTLLTVILFLSQIVRQCRREIGILRALGTTRVQAVVLFGGIVLMVTLIASVIGMMLGEVVAGVTGNLYADAVCMPRYRVRLSADVCLISIGITAATEMLAAMIGAASIVRIQPSEAMRLKDVSGVQVPEPVERHLSDGGPIFKFTVLSAMRNAGRFFTSVLCIAAALTMILSGLAFDYAKDAVMTQLFDERIAYDCQILLQDYPDPQIEDEIRSLDGVSAVEAVVFLPAQVSFNGKTESILINGITQNSLIHILGKEGKELSVAEEGIILDCHLAERMGICVGDTVMVEGVPLTVTALSNHYVSRAQYMSCEQAFRLSDECGGALLVNTQEEEILIDYAAGLDGYGGATFTRLLQRTTQESFELYSVGVYVVIAFAFCLGMLIVFHMTKTNLVQQHRELGILRIMGLQRRQISHCWLGQSIVQYLLALALGLPIGTAVAQYILNEMSTASREYPFSSDMGQYAMTAALVLGFVLVSHMLAMAEMRRWNLAEAAKSDE